MSRALLGLLLAAGCGVSSNNTATSTLPWHASLDDIRDYRRIDESQVVQLRTSGPVTVGAFVPYYPLPAGLAVMAGSPTLWAGLDLPPAEVALAAAWQRVLSGGGGAALVVRGVVTDFEWYEAGGMHGGRIASILVVTDAGGAVLFEQERVTTGRATTPAALVADHVREWTRDGAFRRAVGASE